MSEIEHLILSGGGMAGIIEYGIIKHLMDKKKIDMENIKSIYGTSIGSWLAVCFSLKYEIDILDDYIIKRPWNKILTTSYENMLEIFSNKGIFDEKIIKESFKPLFEAKDIDINCTMIEFYEKTNIELYFYTTDINSFTVEELSHIKNPELSVVKAVTMSCAIPILFTPIEYNNRIYVDGGFMNNYPLDNCIDRNQESLDNILGIRFSHNYITDSSENIDKSTDFIKYLLMIMRTIMAKLSYDNNTSENKIKNEILIPIDKESLNIKSFNVILSSAEEKKKLIERGIEYCRVFLQYNAANDSN